MSGLSERARHEIEMHREVAGMYRRRSQWAFAEDFQRERNEILLGLAPRRPAGVALDLGCGTGLLLGRLAERFARVVGLDISQEMLDGHADAAGDRIGLARADMAALPLQPSTIDVVFCRSALHHMDDEGRVLAEVARVLKADGRLILGEPANDNVLTRAARAWARRGKSYGKLHTIDRAYTRAELAGLLARAGLAVEREQRFGFLAYPLCDNPDLVPVLKHLPFATAIGAALRAFDRVLARVPLLRTQSWYTMLEVRRAGPLDA